MAGTMVRKFGTGGGLGGDTLEDGDTPYFDVTDTDTGSDFATDPSLDLGGNSDDWGALASALGIAGPESSDSAYPQFSSNGQAVTTAAPQNDDLGILGKVLKGVGLSNGKNGFSGIDFSDPNTMTRLGKLLGLGGNVYDSLTGGNKPPPVKSVAEIKSQFASPFSGFTPIGQAAYTRMNNTPYATRTPHALKAYAEGGQAVDDNNPQFFSEGAFARHFTDGGASGGGQDDIIPARLAPKEYVLDADTVSNIGDGNPDHGSAKLDQWRENLRAHKRSAPPNKIPPKTKALDSYMPKGKK